MTPTSQHRTAEQATDRHRAAERATDRHRAAERATDRHRAAERATDRHRAAERATDRHRAAERATDRHRAAERAFRELLAEQGLPPPAEVEYEESGVLFLWPEPKLAVVVELSDRAGPSGKGSHAPWATAAGANKTGGRA